jgi:hypothetical protein
MDPRLRAIMWSVLAIAGPAVVIWLVAGEKLEAALVAFPPLAAALAVSAHVVTLTCRCEAWRLAVHSGGSARQQRVEAHAAAGAGFAAGIVQGASTAPVRALAMRRLNPAAAPSLEHGLVAEVPVVLVDAAITALVLALVLAFAASPGWAAVTVGGATLTLAVAALGVHRFSHHRFTAGLRVLADRRRLLPLASLVAAMTACGLARVWLTLAGFDLPHDPATVGGVHVALALFGLIPIGAGSTPGATLAVLGAGDSAVAAAAGLALSGTSIAAVGVYALCASATIGLTRARSSQAGRRAAWTIRSRAQPDPSP